MVNKTITVRFGKCTTLLVPKSWPTKAWLRDVDQWKAENLEGFCKWLITRCFIQNDRARLIIEHTTDFALSGNIDGPCNIRHVMRSAAIVIHIAISVTNIAASGSRMDAITFYLAVIRGVARRRPGSIDFNIFSIIA